ncbi:uncharacterized protein LOC144611570 isoform X2 [Rhinoraja longicauda]
MGFPRVLRVPPRSDVKKKSQRTFKKLIESPTQTPYFVCIPMYWGLLLITPLLPKCLKTPWVLHCSLDQFIVLFSWWRCYRNFHRRGLRDDETFDQTDNKYLLYSIESPHIVHSYMDIEEGAERLIRAHKAAVLQELREKLAKQMTKIQGLTKQCAQTVGQNQPSSFKP